MNTYQWLRRARRAADELHAQGRTLPLAEVFYADRPTRDLLEALHGLGILQRRDIVGDPGAEGSPVLRRVA